MIYDNLEIRLIIINITSAVTGLQVAWVSDRHHTHHYQGQIEKLKINQLKSLIAPPGPQQLVPQHSWRHQWSRIVHPVHIAAPHFALETQI